MPKRDSDPERIEYLFFFPKCALYGMIFPITRYLLVAVRPKRNVVSELKGILFGKE